ncbi:hypothetical protein MWMV17_MWMV17_01186 [Acinetobacter calcoaceticus]|uniref:Uncharacterized protein n=1 Tax=Acinetobacter calcoaceticus DSM 30006 = CIP 81.8 TaxID=981331 RepID=A0ABP2UGE4_ACICA|nr:hypothetical protein F936_02593 [Acinetobacter calcoaceticus DSM 30006 = CIP 81.8]CAI3120536.1 hypothetical protein MWMV17_MWMV17_01186 [Acinetobacter calcoaceticus]SUU53612.1 Uncharacterised protein [Acinetobacter calcoaceticus]
MISKKKVMIKVTDIKSKDIRDLLEPIKQN